MDCWIGVRQAGAYAPNGRADVAALGGMLLSVLTGNAAAPGSEALSDALGKLTTNLPAVARTCEPAIWHTARRPTRAVAPRTEITRPKDVTVIEPDLLWIGSGVHYGGG